MKQNRESRRRVIRATSLAAMITAAALALSACSAGASEGSTTGGAGGTITVAMGPPLSLDPASSAPNVPGYYVMWAYDPLIRWSGSGDFEPALATSWKYTDDTHTQFILELRDGVTFADGEDVTADAVANSINYMHNGFGPNAGYYAGLEAAATGDLEVTVTSDSPNPYLEQLFSNATPFGVISPKGLADPQQLATATFGSGPYVLDSSQTVEGDHYTYVKNDSYWDASAIHWDKVVMQVIQDENAGLAAVQAGQVDVFTGGSATTASAAESAGLQVPSGLAYYTGLLLLDTEGQIVPALGDVRVRQALSMAIDRQSIATAVLGDGAAPLAQPFLPSWVGYQDSLEDTYAYDPDKAKELLAEAGYPDGFTIPVVTNAGSILELEIQAIAGQLADIGVTVDIQESANTPELVGDLSQGTAAAYNLEQAYTNPLFQYQFAFSGTAQLNGLKQVDPKLEALVDTAAQASADDSEAAWQAVDQYMVDNVSTIPVAASYQYYYVATDIDYGQLNPTTALLDPLQLQPKG